MSRRLDISSLLCPPDDEDVVLAPHLKARPAAPAAPPHIHHNPPPRTFEPPPSKPVAFVGFDALVHAATEERRRLSSGELPHQHLQQPQPLHHHHQQPQPQQPPRLAHRSPWQEDQHYPPELPRHPFDDLGHQVRQYQHKRGPSQHELDRIRAHDIDRQRLAEQDRLADLERKNLFERQKMEEERRMLEEERIRLLQLERRLQEQEAARRREDEDRETRRRDEREREVAAMRDAERREQERREQQRQTEIQLQLQRKQREELQQQRMYEMQRADMDRLRRHQQQQAMQQQAQQQHSPQQQQQQQQQHQPQYALHHRQQQHSPPLQRHYEPPPRIEIPPGPQHPVRKVDQSPPAKPQSQSPHLGPDQRPAKKPRYSDSPSLGPSTDDKDRLIRERERMSVGEIGYGRLESPVVAPQPSSSSSARPNSGNGFRRPVSVSDLLSPEPSLLPTPIEPHHPPLRIISREKDPAPHHNRILSPLGRRSPPGSQVGRAKAARKSDEYGPLPITPSTSSTSATVTHPPPLSPPSPPLTKKPVVKEEHGVKRQKIEELLAEIPKKAPLPVQMMRVSPVSSHPRQLKHPLPQHGDAHDWLLEHYAQPSPPTKKDNHHHHHASTRSPTAPRRTLSPVVQVKKQSPSPVMQNEEDNALEQELDDLLAEVNIPTKEEAMDVDSVVAELVAETLEGVDEEPDPHQQGRRVDEVMPLATDVEDELLSLIDDKLPPSASSTSAARRASTSSVSFAPPSTRLAKQSPPPLRMSDLAGVRQVSPVVTTSPMTSVAPRSETAKPKSERGSMPPPPLVTNKERDQEEAPKEKKETRETGLPMPASKKRDAGVSKAKGKATAADSSKATMVAEELSPPLSAKPRSKPPKGRKAAASTSTKLESATPTYAPTHSVTSISVPTKASNAPSRKTTSTSVSRSRSTSVMPGHAADDATPTPSNSAVEDKIAKAEKQEEEEDSDAANEDDNRLYCVCKTKYDQERCMIACDRCDEWYHMQCVDMSESVADLVDQFFCPPCIEKNLGLNLQTTYKQRCLWGQKHPDPSSSRACHKPGRGAFSKYCSDECGVKYMQSRIDTWAKKGGKKDKLWESVKSAEKREGVVVRVEECVSTPSINGCPDQVNAECKRENDVTDLLKSGYLKPAKPAKAKVQREGERLTKNLEQVVLMGNELKKGMEVVVWREKLLELASERSENVGQCGWDQRLCFGDEEWAAQGRTVLESYEDRGEVDMDVDGQSECDEDWWCCEEAACSRHMGWQTTRYKDICKEKEKKEEALQKMTIRESEIRKRLEDIANPQVKRTGTVAGHQERNGTTVKASAAQGPLASSNAKISNGHSHKSKASGGDVLKKSKKRKAPAS